MGENAGENGRSEALGENTLKTAGNNEMCNCNAKKRKQNISVLCVYSKEQNLSCTAGRDMEIISFPHLPLLGNCLKQDLGLGRGDKVLQHNFFKGQCAALLTGET